MEELTSGWSLRLFHLLSVGVSPSITAPEPHDHPINTNSGPSRRGRPITAASRAEAIKIQSQISGLLGGSAFLSTPFFECHFGEGKGSTYWDLVLSAVRVVLEIDGSSSEKTGQFPRVLKEKLSQVTRRRLNGNTTSLDQKCITAEDLQTAITALRSEHGVPGKLFCILVLSEMSRHSLTFCYFPPSRIHFNFSPPEIIT